MKKAARKAKAAADITAMLVAMASFYAGKPVTVSYGERNTTGPAGSSAIEIDGEVRASLERLLANMKAGTPQKADVYGIGTLLHEALHTRGPDMHDQFTGASPRDPNTGFYSWDDETQARQLGYQLVPDAMQRFFGVKTDSPQGKQFLRQAQSAGQGFGALPGQKREFWMDGREVRE